MNKATMPTIEAQVEYLRNMPDEKIDIIDIPEVLDFTAAERGRFYRPMKHAVTLRLDVDILEWFKRNKPKYQTAINQALRQYVIAQA